MRRVQEGIVHVWSSLLLCVSQPHSRPLWVVSIVNPSWALSQLLKISWYKLKWALPQEILTIWLSWQLLEKSRLRQIEDMPIITSLQQAKMLQKQLVLQLPTLQCASVQALCTKRTCLARVCPRLSCKLGSRTAQLLLESLNLSLICKQTYHRTESRETVIPRPTASSSCQQQQGELLTSKGASSQCRPWKRWSALRSELMQKSTDRRELL